MAKHLTRDYISETYSGKKVPRMFVASAGPSNDREQSEVEGYLKMKLLVFR